jgi:hypothetical protein
MRRVRTLDVLREIEQVHRLRPDLTAKQCQAFYRSACDKLGAPHGPGDWEYSGSQDVVVITDKGPVRYHAEELWEPLFDVPEFQVMLAHLEPRPSPRAGRPSGRDLPLLDRLADAYRVKEKELHPLVPVQDDVADAAGYASRSGMTSAMSRHQPPIRWDDVIARAHEEKGRAR